MVMAIDPGRDKCGLVVMDKTGEIKLQNVIETSTLKSAVLEIINRFDLQLIILGNGTTSGSAKKIISAAISAANRDIKIEVVDERHTTEEARKLYWRKNPPTSWRRFLPTSMQVPPKPVDDIVAEILARRFLFLE
ncbi:MAG: Holliday junction resolvase RuvX [Selenomonadaceae bacterium]|nr:Holliday junction resolvase RuvX [Selenomonadaceae bacterium]MBR1858073.1 Holliday junction resolvase RuvX [Selenomonadaceae bacterium]